MNNKRILTTAAAGALTLGTIVGCSEAQPSAAEQSTSARVTAPQAAAPTAVTALPQMPFLPLNLAQKAATTALADCIRQGSQKIRDAGDLLASAVLTHQAVRRVAPRR